MLLPVGLDPEAQIRTVFTCFAPSQINFIMVDFIPRWPFSTCGKEAILLPQAYILAVYQPTRQCFSINSFNERLKQNRHWLSLGHCLIRESKIVAEECGPLNGFTGSTQSENGTNVVFRGERRSSLEDTGMNLGQRHVPYRAGQCLVVILTHPVPLTPSLQRLSTTIPIKLE